MIITSIHSEERGTGLVRLVVEDYSIKLLNTWQSSPSDTKLFEAIALNYADRYLINSNGVVVEGKPHSALAEVLKSRDYRPIKVLTPISTLASSEILRELQAKGEFEAANWDEWQVISVEVARIEKHKTARAMALLQGVVAADKQRNRVSASFVSARVEQPAPYIPSKYPTGEHQGGQYIPTEQWGTRRW